MSNILNSYEEGMNRLLKAIGKDHTDYIEALTFQLRLLENIKRSQTYGDTDSASANRLEILYNLNLLAIRVSGKSFNEFCGFEEQSAFSESSNDKKSYENPEIVKKLLIEQRNRITEWEKLFDTITLRDLTVNSISLLEGDLREIITGLRNIPYKNMDIYISNVDYVLTQLRGACDQLNPSLDILEKRGRTPQYYRHLRGCQKCLSNVLRYW